MGQCCSKHDWSEHEMDISSQVPNPASSALVGGAEASLGAAAESVELEPEMEETEFSLAALPTVNPSAASFSRGLAAVQAMLQGVNVRVTMAAPLEIAARLFMNAALNLSKDTDIGDWVAKRDLTTLQEGVTKLQDKELLQASEQMIKLVQQAAQIPDIKDEGLRQNELQLFMSRVEQCLDHAQVSRRKQGSRVFYEAPRATCIAALASSRSI